VIDAVVVGGRLFGMVFEDGAVKVDPAMVED